MHGVPCPGYSRPFAFRFQSGHNASTILPENRFREDQHREEVLQRSAAPSTSDVTGMPFIHQVLFGKDDKRLRSLSTLDYQSLRQNNNIERVSLRAQCLEPDWEAESVQFFMTQQVIPAQPGFHPGHFDFLPALYLSDPEDSCLKLAIHSVAYLTMYYHSKSMRFYYQAFHAYGSTLRSIRGALHSDLGNKLHDNILAAVLLLNIFHVG